MISFKSLKKRNRRGRETDEEKKRAAEFVLSLFLFHYCSMCTTAGEDNEETGRDESGGLRLKAAEERVRKMRVKGEGGREN